MPRKYVKTGLYVRRGRGENGTHKPRYKTRLGNRGNELWRELELQEREWRKQREESLV